MREGYFLRDERMWLHTRQIISTVINWSSNKKGKQFIKPSAIMPLSFDRKKNTKPRKTQYTPEEMDKLRKKFKIAS